MQPLRFMSTFQVFEVALEAVDQSKVRGKSAALLDHLRDPMG
jgi:hypothetical protein